MELVIKEKFDKIVRLSNPEFHKALGEQLQVSLREELLEAYLIREADRRKIWAEMSFASLKMYCIESFNLSETDFYRKKNIAEAIRENPEIENKILAGKLNPTTVSIAASFLKREAKIKKKRRSAEQKLEI